MTDTLTTTPGRYSAGAIFLHWTLAALLVFQVSLGFRLEDLPRGAERIAANGLHKSIGITILMLTLVRLLWRLLKPRPLAMEQHPALMWLAKATHALLYFVMVAGPLTGWAISSTGRSSAPIVVFGLFPWPALPLAKSWHKPAEVAHELVAFLLIGLFVLHVAGALRHHFLRDDLIGRMLPRAMVSRSGQTAGLFAALVAATLAVAWAWTSSFAAS